MIARAYLSHCRIQIPAEEEGLRSQEIAGDTWGIDEYYCPESSPIADKLSDDTTNEYAKSHADVPRNEYGRVGSASLVVLGHIDAHILESGPHVSVAQAYQQSWTIIAHHDGGMILREASGH